MDDCTFYQNNGGLNSIIITRTNSKAFITTSRFEENFSVGRGSCIFADLTASKVTITDSSFLRNYAY